VIPQTAECGLEATFFVVMPTLLNIIGVRESSRFNELLGALDVVSESAILFFGFLFAFNPTMLIHQMTTSWPDAYHLAKDNLYTIRVKSRKVLSLLDDDYSFLEDERVQREK
jgi:hypothetical protein